MGVQLALVSVDTTIGCFVFANTERSGPAPKIADINQLAGELYAVNELLLAGMGAGLTQAQQCGGLQWRSPEHNALSLGSVHYDATVEFEHFWEWG
jgi:hypothetical protein